MKKSLTILAFTIATLAIVLIYFLLKKSSELNNFPAVARTDYVSGEVIIKRQDTFSEGELKQGDPLFDFDRISTSQNSSVIFSTERGDQVRLDENSMATVESNKKNDGVLVTIISGTHQVLKNSGALLVNNLRDQWKSLYFTATVVSSTPPPAEATLDPETSTSTPPVTETPSETVVEVSEVDGTGIKKILDGQKGFLNRCYAKHLVGHPEAKGKMVIGFMLQSSGKPAQIRVLSTTFNDNELESCVSSVIERSPFKRFSGDSIYITYPIDFE